MDLAAQNSAAAQYNLNKPSSSATLGGSSSGTELAYIPDNADSYVNAVNQQALWNREDLLRKEANEWDAHELDRIVDAAKRNGINPIFLLDAMNGGSSASYTTSAAKTSNYEANDRTEQANSAKVFGSLIAALAVIAAAVL